jgi:hypothetical protein
VTEPSQPGKPGWLSGGLPFAIVAVCLAATLPFLPALGDYFTGDDFGLVQLFSGKPLLHVLTLFTSAWTEDIYGILADELRPTIALSYQLDSLWGAGWPNGYRLGNLLVHLLNCLLVLLAGRRLAGLRPLAAGFGAVLFALLPIHPESVFWISGRADSIPAFFYLAAFVAYGLWRQGGSPWLYGAALAAHLLGLFSKQSGIMLLATLVAYDALIERRYSWLSWRAAGRYLPFLLLTVGYLGLRYLLFRNAVREDQISPQLLETFLARQLSFVYTLVQGAPLPLLLENAPQPLLLGRWLTLLLLGLALLLALAELRPAAQARPAGLLGRLLFFGPIWWLLCIAPLAVTYETPRHLYLAAVGPCLATALLLDHLGRGRQPIWRWAAVGLGLALLAASLQVQQPILTAWRSASGISLQIQRDLEREALAAPPDSLLVVAAPVIGVDRSHHTWIWAWALPFAARPPFSQTDLHSRVGLVALPAVFCCPPEQWYARTQATIAEWAGRQPAPPAIVLIWDDSSGALIRQDDQRDPSLRERLLEIGRARDPTTMCRLLDDLVGQPGEAC